MKTSDWKSFVMQKAEPLLGKRSTPLPVKEFAWKMINFATNCGISHPISYALRPMVMNKHLRLMIGINLIVFAILAATLGPIPSLADNAGGPVTLTVVSDGEVTLTTKDAVVSPLPNKLIVSQGFWLLHAGIDLPTAVGTPVKPIMKGRVTKAEKGWFGYGNMVIVRHNKEYESLYAHLSKIDVQVGQDVSTDTVLGESGNTGRSTGPHLHLEVHQEGKIINPSPLLGLN